jgi:phosphate transport system protein
MARHLIREVEKLKKMVLTLSAIVEESVHKAVRAIERRDADLAQRVIGADVEIDHMEVDIEEECLKTLALYQPVATDLRFIVAVLKLSNDLERIGDLASNIAKRAKVLAGHPHVEVPAQIPVMAEKSQSLLKRALDALVNLDPALARQVMSGDDEVDELFRQVGEQITVGLRQQPDHIAPLLQILHAARHLERISDHASNIARDVIYMVDGEFVRPKPEEGTAGNKAAASA